MSTLEITFYKTYSKDGSQKPTSQCQLLKTLSEQLDDEYIEIPVRRGHVLWDALRAKKRPTFICSNILKVKRDIVG